MFSQKAKTKSWSTVKWGEFITGGEFVKKPTRKEITCFTCSLPFLCVNLCSMLFFLLEKCIFEKIQCALYTLIILSVLIILAKSISPFLNFMIALPCTAFSWVNYFVNFFSISYSLLKILQKNLFEIAIGTN